MAFKNVGLGPKIAKIGNFWHKFNPEMSQAIF